LRQVDAKLIELLEELSPEEWDLPTLAPGWLVRDIAAHLLDTSLRKLSLLRDGAFVERVEIQSPEELAALVHRLNQEGVRVYRRLSPRLLVQMMRVACAESAEFHEGLDPMAPAAFSVSWAGEAVSMNWFDTARELTERWHHQQQIREASGRPSILTPEFYRPVLECFARALPYTFRHQVAAEGQRVRLEVSGNCGGVWQIRWIAGAWEAEVPDSDPPEAHLVIPQELAWRLFTNSLSRDEALGACEIHGEQRLAEQLLQARAIIV
jgi:uncharacterized protein (TIGR03083 family)